MTAFIENQMYLAQVVDQGYSNTKNGEQVFKLFVRLIGKVNDFVDPTKDPTPIASEEIEIPFRLYGNPDHVKFRLRDLINLGFKGDDIFDLSPESESHHSFVGQKILVVPKYPAGADPETTRPWWNTKALSTANGRGSRKFVNDVPAGELRDSIKAKGLNALMAEARSGKKSDGGPKEVASAATEEAIPF